MYPHPFAAEIEYQLNYGMDIPAKLPEPQPQVCDED